MGEHCHFSCKNYDIPIVKLRGSLAEPGNGYGSAFDSCSSLHRIHLRNLLPSFAAPSPSQAQNKKAPPLLFGEMELQQCHLASISKSHAQEERECKQKLFGMYAYPFNMSRNFQSDLSLAEIAEAVRFFLCHRRTQTHTDTLGLSQSSRESRSFDLNR